MRLRQFAIVATAAAVFAGTGTSALAHEGHGHGAEPAPDWKADRMHHGTDPHARDAWMEECERRLDRGRSESEARDECAAFLDDYYAHYRGSYGYRHMGYGYPAQGYGMGCCQQPMMMVPIVRQQTAEPECTETVEYEYVDVPVRAKPRPVPQKRVKVVPDKRVKVVPDKRIRTK